MKNIINISFSILIIAVILISCKKEPEIVIEKEYITITDTIIKIDTIIETLDDSKTTFILLRHAETLGGINPSISTIGLERISDLKRLCANINIEAVLSTDYLRTVQTADSVAVDHSLTTEIYDGFDIENVVDENIETYKNKTILIIGHSNTTVEMLNIITATNNFSEISEDEYDNIYIVEIKNKGNATVLHMKYGD